MEHIEHRSRGMIGTKFGSYQIDSVLGQGGMGTVYRAVHEGLQREVALKVLAENFAQDPTFRRRFVRESQLSASIDHPNIVPVYDAGELNGKLYLVTKLIVGSTLKELVVQTGPLHPRRTVAILSQIASALDTSHDSGLIHRDVKPQNILVQKSSKGEHRAFLTDFGLTKHSESSSGITETGTFLGTVDYAAPEQIAGEAIDGRTDLYALACVAYELLSGKVPYDKGSDMANLFAHQSEVPPPLAGDALGLSESVDLVIQKAMSLRKADRHPTCTDFVDALNKTLQTSPETLPGPSPLELGAQRTLPPVYSPPIAGGLSANTTPLPQPNYALAQPPPAPKRSWVGPIVGLVVLLLAGAAALGFFLLQSNDSNTSNPTTGGAAQEDPELGAGDFNTSGPATNVRPDSIEASGTAPPGIDSSGASITYEADNVLDGVDSTAWRTAGSGKGTRLVLSFGSPVLVTRIGLIPGYAKIDPNDFTDRFFENRRVLAVDYIFSDGTVKAQNFTEIPQMQTTSVNEVTEEIEILIAATSPHGGRNFTAISEVQVEGFAN
jgi:serine/threonine protein kinase